MGTPDIAVSPLVSLIEAGHEIAAVITGADKPRGRSGEPVPTPVKAEALKRGITVLHPAKLRDPEFIEYLRSLEADAYIVVAYGRIIPKEILDIPRYGCINIHASLLPSLRGAAPIQWAVIDGLKQTGITTMLMDEGLDTGDIIKQYVLDIADDETGGSLFDRLAPLAGEAIVDTLELIESGKAVRTPQGETDTRYASMLTKEDGNIDWTRGAEELERLVRGLDPWPASYSFLNGKMVKIWKTRTVSGDSGDAAPGTVVSVEKDAILVAAGQGILAVTELQLEGKKRLSADALLRGYKIEPGSRFSRER